MRNLKVLTSKDESLVSSLIKAKKTSSYILFYHSEWDKNSQKILSLAEKWSQEEGIETCYVVSSWELPHVFSAFGVTSAPAVVEVNNGDIKVYVEFPRIYDFFSQTQAE